VRKPIEVAEGLVIIKDDTCHACHYGKVLLYDWWVRIEEENEETGEIIKSWRHASKIAEIYDEGGR
jgi:hypothetical protein